MTFLKRSKLTINDTIKYVVEHEVSTRGLNVLWLLILLGAEEVNGCLHGPLNQMAITTLNTNKVFSALVIEPQRKFASRISPNVLKQTLQHSENFNKQNQLTRHDRLSETPPPAPPLLPLPHYIANAGQNISFCN